jgi:hypothetical protein
MQNDNEILSVIIYHFPHHRTSIYELFQESESFRLLCKDYYDCRKVFDESIKKSNKISDLQKEYEAMLLEIEDELLGRITI